MAENMQNGDLVNLDEATQLPLDGGAGSSGGDTVIHAAEIFQQQLEQMTAWKTQLSQQMEHMRSDGLKLLERQKFLAQEKVRLADERTQLANEHTQIQQSQTQLAADNQKLAERAAQLNQAQARLAELEHQRDVAQQELAARERALTEQEAHHLAEDVRLREGIEQLEEQRRHLAQAQQQATHDREKLDTEARDMAARAKALDQHNQSLNGREQELGAAQARLESAQAQLQSKEENLAASEQSLTEKLRITEAELQSRAAELHAGEQHIAADREATAKLRHNLQKRIEAFEQEQAEQLETLARQTKRLTERRAAIEAAENDLEEALAARIAEATESLNQELAQARGGNQEHLAQLEQQLAERQEQLAQNEAAAKSWQTQETQYHAQLQELQKAKDDLEFQLELSAEELSKQLNALRQQLVQEVTQRDAEIADWKQKFEAAQSAAAVAPGKSSSQHTEKIQELARQVQMLEQQRNEIAAQLFAVQDVLRHQQEEALLSKNVLEGRLLELEEKNSALEAEKSTWKKVPTHTPSATAPLAAPGEASLKQSAWHRERLLKQAKALRTFRQQIRDTQTTMASSRTELAQQREQIRARKENLEQVKRLLEKQEMVMARKLADHNAIKTVAAVGIFVIMVLGSVFFGVYRFVRPVYRSEAVVQLAAPQNLPAAELDGWLKQQMEFVRSNDVTFAAWKILRSADEHYAMHDVRDEWLGTLPSRMNLMLDGASKTLSVRYTGPDAQGVSQVCNALATAYAAPGMRDPAAPEATRAIGLGSQILAKATAPLYPVEDNRMMVSMSLVAIVLFVSLILVMIFRHFIARQLKEIDQMADAEDLEGMHGELPEGASPATE